MYPVGDLASTAPVMVMFLSDVQSGAIQKKHETMLQKKCLT